uniref:Uncharacterized protein n=1 Tax=Peronospora matthiolae TaxID=2874970 RepID=A0AAV1T8D1_9STRA
MRILQDRLARSADYFVITNHRKRKNKEVEDKPKKPTKKYSRIYEFNDSEDAIKMITLLEKDSENKIAPLRVKVRI